jgi:hypothetical protein
VPPLVGVAVKVTEVPEHIVEAVALMETAGVTDGLTVIAMLFDVAVVGEAQVTEEVITQLTASPFTKEVVVYTELLEPVFPPFSFH